MRPESRVTKSILWLVLLSLVVMFVVAVWTVVGARAMPQPTETSMANWQKDCESMVSKQIEARDVRDRRVLAAMRKVARHRFVPDSQKPFAYEDRPLPIGEGQTISQPYIVAKMTELLELSGDEHILEIGTGSGYQAAILAELVAQVTTIEIVQPLCESARVRLARLGYDRITVICGDGYQGYPRHAPFDGIIVTAAPKQVPQPLVDQLKVGARMVIPVGDVYQELMVLTKRRNGTIKRRSVFPVRFVPMTGEAR